MGMRQSMIADKKGRGVSYLRVSVTDRCNLRCRYCVGHDMGFIPHPDILRYEEIREVIGLVAENGVDKVRFTGGEPFVRKGFMDFMEDLSERFPTLNLCATTNATMIGDHISRLAAINLGSLNISLDTLDPSRFKAITGRDMFHKVRTNIDRCVEAGVHVKINVVAMKDVNRCDLAGFVQFARTMPVDVRFIEFMPIGDGTDWSQDHLWMADDILADIRELADLTPELARHHNSGPARMYSVAGGMGRIGVISSLSNHFCAECNRLRLTSNGRLRTCLFSDKVYRIREALRNPHLGSDAIQRIIQAATRNKPLGYELLQARKRANVCHTRMAAIGG